MPVSIQSLSAQGMPHSLMVRMSLGPSQEGQCCDPEHQSHNSRAKRCSMATVALLCCAVGAVYLGAGTLWSPLTRLSLAGGHWESQGIKGREQSPCTGSDDWIMYIFKISVSILKHHQTDNSPES